MEQSIISAAKKALERGIITTITFKTKTVALVNVSKNGQSAEELTAISHRGIPTLINELADKVDTGVGRDAGLSIEDAVDML